MLFITAIGTAVGIALLAVLGVFAFGHDKRLIGAERYVVPVAVGVFLSLIFNELVPGTLAASTSGGAAVIVAGFIAFYVLSHMLHQRYHHLETEDCDRRGAAALLLIGDGVHNFADGIILGAAFLVDPAVGFATAVGLALHEIRAGYTRARAALANLLSASTVVLGTITVLVLSEHLADYVWVLVGLAAGNILFLATSELLPRVHGNLGEYGSIWYATGSIVLGFVLMTLILGWAHEEHGGEVLPGHTHEIEELDDHAHE